MGGCRRELRPFEPGHSVALGLLTTDVKHEFSQTRVMRGDRADVGAISQTFRAMEKEG
jgi:hypothetical protein